MDFELRKLRILGLSSNFLIILFYFFHLEDMKQTSELCSLVKLLNHQLPDICTLFWCSRSKYFLVHHCSNCNLRPRSKEMYFLISHFL